MRWVVALILLLPRAAGAEPGAWPTRPLVLDRGTCELALAGEASLTIRETGEPTSLAPDLRCGVTPRVTLGVVHSARALSRIDSGDGVCLSGDEHGCARVYDGGALDALYDLAGPHRAVAVAARARLVAKSLEPFKPSLRLGALVRLGRGPAALLLDPNLSTALAARELGNADFVALPARAQLLLGRRVVLELVTGVHGELRGFDEKLAIPVGAGILVALTSRLDLALEAGFPKLLGPQNTFKQRHAALTITYRFATATPLSSAASYTAD